MAKANFQLPLAAPLANSQSVISDIINYKRGFSKDVIRKLENKFGIAQ